MLTKDLLKYTVRGSRIHPKYVECGDKALLDQAVTLESIFQGAVGQRYCDLQTSISELIPQANPVQAGLIKLLEERCRFQEADEEIEKRRWQIFQLSRELRQQTDSRDNLNERMAGSLGADVESLRNNLYGDLPDQRLIDEFRPFGAEALLNRYNCAQIQGLILRAKFLDFEIDSCDLQTKRRLFQKLKFHRLFPEVISEQPLCIRLSGPMALFESAQTYGMRLANFFPYLLLLKSWKIRAELRINGRDLELEASSKRPIVSHYQALLGHIPEEYQKFIDMFGKRSQSAVTWQAQAADDFLHLGQQSYCFPDFKLSGADGRMIYIELFHRWHQHQLQQRLQAIQTGRGDIMIGICNHLKIDGKTQKRLDELASSGVKSFIFKGFPSPRAVLAQLA